MINIITNAISNSYESAANNGIVISLRYDKTEQQIQVTVEDHGIGIPEEEQY